MDCDEEPVFLNNDFANSNLQYKVADNIRATMVMKKGNFLLDDHSDEDDSEEDLDQDMCKIRFKVKYQTKFGQQLCVIGDVPELGSWKNLVGKMHWSKDHMWKLNVKVANVSEVNYKFIILNQNQSQKWESGENRTVDLTDKLGNKV